MARFIQSSLPVPVIGNSGAKIALSTLLANAYSDQVNQITSIRIGYFNDSYLLNATDSHGGHSPFLYWDDIRPRLSTVLNKGRDIGGSSAATDVGLPTSFTTVDSAHFKDISISLGNNIMPNIFIEIVMAGEGSADPVYQALSVATVPASIKNTYRFPHTPEAVVSAAHKAALTYGGTYNTNDCHWIASDIAAAAGATFSPWTQNTVNPSENEEGGFWRIAYRGSDSATPTRDWQSLVRPGDIVRLAWDSGGYHTVTVTAGQNADGLHPGMIKVVDNLAGAGKNEIGEHWVNYNGNVGDGHADLSVSASITIYRLTTDGLYLIGDSDQSDKIVGSVYDDDIRGYDGYDFIYAGVGNDTVYAGEKSDYVYGGKGNDTLYGQQGQDNLYGEDGNDTLYGGGGADWLDGGKGADVMRGEAGSDVYVVDNVSDFVSELGGSGASYDPFRDWGGTDEIRTTLASYRLPDPIAAFSGSGFIENLTYTGNGKFYGIGNSLANVIRGGNGADTLDGRGGNDTMYGGGGADTYWVDSAADVVSEVTQAYYGPPKDAGGWDQVIATSSSYTLPDAIANVNGLIEELSYSGNGPFVGTGNSLDNIIRGGIGADTLDGREGNDEIFAGMQVDTVIGGVGNDKIHGGDQGDLLYGGFTSRAAATDFDGNDEIFADDGDDTIVVLWGNDKVHGGRGTDTLSFAEVTSDLVLDIASGKTSYYESGSFNDPGGGSHFFLDYFTVRWDSIENLTAGTGNDVITGDRNANVLIGGLGNDFIAAGAGNDIMTGGPAGGGVSDGLDTFSFARGWGQDTITDFNDLEDQLDFSAVAGLTSIYDFTITDTAQGLKLQFGADSVFLNGVHTIEFNFRFAGNANVKGTSKADTLAGSAADDTMRGLTGDDTLFGTPGADMLDGGPGFDTADYSASKAGILIDFPSGTISGGDAEGDTLFSIERIIGSKFDDTFSGTSADEVFIGGKGSDNFFGEGGNDIFEIVGNSKDYKISAFGGVNPDGTEWQIVAKDGSFDVIHNVDWIRFSDTTIDTSTLPLPHGGTGEDDTFLSTSRKEIFSGNGGADTFLMSPGTADGDVITDLSADDVIQFYGFGAGATLTATRRPGVFSINYDGGTKHELITVTGHNALVASDDYFFL